ncbi:uncharacterized protein LOC144350890 [Saccoglossus kowalevskii]
MQQTTNTVVVVNAASKQEPDVMVVEADDGIYMDCDSCPDNAVGRCCRSFWICERGHEIYSPCGKGIGWILVLILIYIIVGSVLICIIIFAGFFCVIYSTSDKD